MSRVPITKDGEISIKENLSKVHEVLADISKQPINKETLYKVLQIQQLEKEILSYKGIS